MKEKQFPSFAALCLHFLFHFHFHWKRIPSLCFSIRFHGFTFRVLSHIICSEAKKMKYKMVLSDILKCSKVFIWVCSCRIWELITKVNICNIFALWLFQMSFASDKLYDGYIRRNMAIIVSKVKPREIMMHLPCLTAYDRVCFRKLSD